MFRRERRLWHALLSLLLPLALLAGSRAMHAADDRPNILWILTEDMGPELGCYGTPQVWTPTLDRLAADGVRYTRAFTVTPVCSTSRSSFSTGMYASTIGAHQHRTPPEAKPALEEGVRVITDWLRDPRSVGAPGYFTANVVTVEGERFGTGKTDWNFQYQGKPFDSAEWDDLKDHQPFYAQVNFSESHRSFTAPKRADPAKVVMPPYYPDHPVARADWAAYLDEITLVDAKVARILELLRRDGLADNTVIAFMGDHGRAHVRGKQWCYDSGLHVPLIIQWPAGIAAPKHYRPGLVDDRLIASIDLCATTLAIAGVKKPDKMQGRVFLGDDAEPPRQYIFGTRDRCDMTVFHIRTVRDEHYRYIRNFMPERPFLQFNAYKEQQYPMIALMRELHAQGKLTPVQEVLLAPHRPAEELYLIDDDPYEINNLAGSPEHQEVLNRLRGVLETWIDQSNDHGRTPEDPAIAEYYRKQAMERAQRKKGTVKSGRKRKSTE